MSDKYFRAASKKAWHGECTVDNINAGSLMRIADATENMAKRHTELIEERDMYELWHNSIVGERDWLQRSNAGLKGYITRLKKQLADERAE